VVHLQELLHLGTSLVILVNLVQLQHLVMLLVAVSV